MATSVTNASSSQELLKVGRVVLVASRQEEDQCVNGKIEIESSCTCEPP